MVRMHTHYDTLKIPREAPPEMVRAARDRFLELYGPDSAGGNDEAARIVVLVNTAYAVLSDPDRRRRYDEWLSERENELAAEEADGQVLALTVEASEDLPGAAGGGFARLGLPVWLPLGIATLLAYLIWSIPDPPQLPVRSRPEARQASSADPPPAQPAYVRPATAPNGVPWPAASGYVEGYEQDFPEGHSELTVDNARNDSDLFAKLFALDAVPERPVRIFFLKAHDRFVLTHLKAGTYELRYRDLGSGTLARSEPFLLEETALDEGVRYSIATLALGPVRAGNPRMDELPEAEF
jgi:hypothetical protein